MRKLAIVFVFSLTLALTAANAEADFINGSFETGDMTGWITSSFTVNPFGTTYGSGMDGIWWHWLGGFELEVVTSQTLTGLTSGTTYGVNFIMASEFENTDQLRVSLAGLNPVVFTAPAYIAGGFNGGFWDNWVAQQYTFVATGTTATIQFDTLGLNTAGYDVGLDKVSLVQVQGVPDSTSTLLLLVISMFAVAIGYRRRQLS